MISNEKIGNFIKTIGNIAKKESIKRKYSKLNWTLPSVCIAQAALETGWGSSDIMTKANAYFGIKWSPGYKAYSTVTREVYSGKDVYIEDMFRAYDTLEDSVADYFRLICDSGIYKKACNQNDALACISAIKNAGYATDPDYVSAVMSIIHQYDLTKYDRELLLPVVEYQSWVKKYKWLGYIKSASSYAGKKGYAIRCVKIKNIPGVGRIKYRVHYADKNKWGAWKIGAGTGVWAGSTRQKIDLIQINLLDSSRYKLEYRSCPSKSVWGTWKKQNSISGEKGKYMEKLQIRINTK